MSTKFCGQCGSELREGAKFCPKCGWKFPIKEEIPVEEIIPPSKTEGPPPTKDFNPYVRPENVKSSFYGEENKKAGYRIGIIVTIVISSILILVMTFLLIKTIKGRSNSDQDESKALQIIEDEWNSVAKIGSQDVQEEMLFNKNKSN